MLTLSARQVAPRWKHALVAAALILFSISASLAATTTSTFQVTTSLAASCVINNASTLAFGSVPVLTGNVDATSTIQVLCSNTSPYSIGLNAGTTAGGTVTVRKMSNGAASTLDYTLWRDAARTLNWGNTVATDTQSGTGTGSAQSYTVYGRIPAQASPSPGAYSDTITVTVTY